MKSAQRAFFVTCSTVVLIAACVPPRGGWDVDALALAEPGMAAFEGSRLGDLIPFPALDSALDPGRPPEEVGLVACRFSSERVVRVRADGEGWPEEWASRAVLAMNHAVAGVDLRLDLRLDPRLDRGSAIEAAASHASTTSVGGDARSGDGRGSGIRVSIIAEVEAEGPSGLGDTLTECDVTPASRPGTVRGEIVEAEIRMRRAQLDIAARVREASAEEWVGAFMHELGHALGFAGHAAVGRSVLVRDEVMLREIGRDALGGQWSPDATLESLYALEPGHRLGSRALDEASVEWLRGLDLLRRERAAKGPGAFRVVASVGDREARLVWRYADGSRLAVRFPDWRGELRSGRAITLVPDASTRRAIALSRE